MFDTDANEVWLTVENSNLEHDENSYHIPLGGIANWFPQLLTLSWLNGLHDISEKNV